MKQKTHHTTHACAPAEPMHAETSPKTHVKIEGGETRKPHACDPPEPMHAETSPKTHVKIEEGKTPTNVCMSSPK